MADIYDFVRKQEGFNPKAYWDNKQWSIGYGTRAAGPDEVIDETEGQRRLTSELAKAGDYVDKAFPNLEPHRKNALASFTYNLGPGWMSSPTRLAAAVKSGDWDGAGRTMLEYNKADGKVLPGLVSRRQAESAMLLGGQPPSSPSGSPAMAGTSLPQSGVAVNAGDTPEQVAYNRRLAQTLMGQGIDTSPVQHWTQALARVVQGGVGGMWQNQARNSERSGQQAAMEALKSALTGGSNPAAAVASGLSTPYGAKMLGPMAGQIVQSQMQQNTPRAKAEQEILDLKLNEAKNPNAAFDRRAAMAEQYGLQKGTREFNEFVLTGDFPRGANAPKDPIAEMELRKRIATDLKFAPGSPAYQSYVATGKMGRDETVTAGDRKAIREADKEVVDYDLALGQLNKALELNKTAGSGFFNDMTSTFRNKTGASNPQSLAAGHLQNILSTEAIKNMSETLKGASTDREMFKFIELAGDVSLPPELRKEYLEAAVRKMQSHRALAARQSNEIRGGDYYKAPDKAEAGGAPAAAPVDPGAANRGFNAPAPNGNVSGQIDFKLLDRNQKREAIKRLVQDPTPETEANFRARFGEQALAEAKAMAEKLRKGTAY